ncbi:glycoside hydrolase [Chitinophaga sp. Cy-1792]|uniref:glycoside hydrolase n=1 Tax=Chitinophaga sp. Cy-1792 TaxID=2608339 RepID=UPI0014219909|nr:glycoside hydrolase [Chitinophaga sp. Cy-1792]NIG57515.1 glycosyl hydrolase [Chitinophaga sp. Cy-1792]
MKKNHLHQFSLPLLVALFGVSCSKNLADNSLQQINGIKAGIASTTPGVDSANISLNWSQGYQQIDGFGAFAGRATPFFQSLKRDSAMESLWGNTGLQLNMIRGEVMYTFPFNKSTGAVTVKPAGVDIDVDINSAAYTSLTDDQKAQISQLWILKTVKQRYQTPIMFASAWTPPLSMKTNTGNVSGTGFNSLNYNTSSTDFANYIAGFAKSYQNEGVNFYAVSPSNEPENVFSSWPACYWTSGHLGQFVSNNLRPALNAQGLNSVKIISSENAAWGTANSFLSSMDKSNVDILAGHGYVEIGQVILGNKGLNQSPAIWNYATANKPVWMTEASDDSGNYDASMAEGMKLATSMHKFFAECNVNAYVYWLGMLDFQNNEALVCTKSDGSLEFPKTYDVFGQFSRFIHPGYFRFAATVSNNSNIKVSAYKKPATGEYSVVVINTGTVPVNLQLGLTGFSSSSITSYTTSAASSAHWAQGTPVAPGTGGAFSVQVPASSVVTFTGTSI